MLLTGNGLPPIVQEERPEDFVGLEIPDRRVVQDATQAIGIQWTMASFVAEIYCR